MKKICFVLLLSFFFIFTSIGINVKADQIYLKSGEVIKTTKCWEKSGLVYYVTFSGPIEVISNIPMKAVIKIVKEQGSDEAYIKEKEKRQRPIKVNKRSSSEYTKKGNKAYNPNLGQLKVFPEKYVGKTLKFYNVNLNSDLKKSELNGYYSIGVSKGNYYSSSTLTSCGINFLVNEDIAKQLMESRSYALCCCIIKCQITTTTDNKYYLAIIQRIDAYDCGYGEEHFGSFYDSSDKSEAMKKPETNFNPFFFPTKEDKEQFEEGIKNMTLEELEMFIRVFKGLGK